MGALRALSIHRPPSLQPDVPPLVPGGVGGARQDPHDRRCPTGVQPRRGHPFRCAGHPARARGGTRATALCNGRLLLPQSSGSGHTVVAGRWRCRHPDNAYRLLHDQGQLSLVFPEGTKGPSKTYADRYRLRRFGRGGFVEIAMRSGVPVIPIAVVGAEESMPILFRINGLAKALKLPYFPVTANDLAFGPLLGKVAYFPAKIKIHVLDPVTFDVDPGLERYSKSRVMDEAERIRAMLQDTLHDMLRERRSVWFG